MATSAEQVRSWLNARIAAICRRHGADLATRSVQDFVDTGIGVLDPSAPAARDER